MSEAIADVGKPRQLFLGGLGLGLAVAAFSVVVTASWSTARCAQQQAELRQQVAADQRALAESSSLLAGAQEQVKERAEDEFELQKSYQQLLDEFNALQAAHQQATQMDDDLRNQEIQSARDASIERTEFAACQARLENAISVMNALPPSWRAAVTLIEKALQPQ